MNTVSDAFRLFASEAPRHQQAWMAAVAGLDEASALDRKTEELAYLAVMAAQGLDSGLPFHVQLARDAGASREELISAVLVGLPAAGNKVVRALPIVLDAWDRGGQA